jgi:Ca-activated chloride channel family protein
MTFLWPLLLWLLLAVPVLVGAYLLLLRRRKKGAVRYASLSLVQQAIGPGQRLRRHVPPALFLLATIAAIIAIARPLATITLPSNQQTIILAIDVSLSMRAADIEPTRLEAAQAAARSFVQALPPGVRIGVVSFAGSAQVVQPPTRNREELVGAIDRFELQRHTAIGSGIIVSLAALFPDEGMDIEALTFGGSLAREQGRGVSLDKAKKIEKKSFAPVPPGSYTSAAIVLLTDGRRTTGPDPLAAAKLAADHGVRVYTVGFGTAEGASVGFEGWSIFMRFDEDALKSIADLTRAEYFHARSATDLHKVYESLTTRLVLEKEPTEITALFAAAAAALALAAALLSLLWFHRTP